MGASGAEADQTFADGGSGLLMPRLCACGCGRSMDGRSSRAIYFSHACAQRVSRRKLQRELNDAGLPTRLNRSLIVSATVPSQNDHGDRETRSRSRSGLQVSYRKAVDAMAERLAHLIGDYGLAEVGKPEDHARRIAESTMSRCLSERQRQRLRGGTA